VEEKRQLALRLKKEAEDKAREEKKAKEAAAKAEKETASPPAEANGKANVAVKPAESGSEQAAGGSKPFEILRRMNDENGDDDEKAVDAPANGTIVDDKAVKPKEITREPPTGPKAQQSWRKKSSTPGQATTTENLEEDGWSTVPSKSKNPRRGGNQGARAIAS